MKLTFSKKRALFVLVNVALAIAAFAAQKTAVAGEFLGCSAEAPLTCRCQITGRCEATLSLSGAECTQSGC